MAQTIADCDAILLAAQRSRGVLMVGYELRHCVLFQEMRGIIDRGDLGAIKLAWAVDNVSVGGNYFYHDRQRRRDYICSLLLQKGCHTIDLLNWFVGGRPKRVFASTGLAVFGGDEPNDKRCRDCARKASCPYAIDHSRFVMDYGAAVERDDLCVYAREVDTPDHGIVLIDYDNGARASFTECHFTPEYSREFWLVGDRAKMYGFYNNEGDFLIRVEERHSRRKTELRPRIPGGGHGGGDPRIQEHFLDCVLRGERPLASLAAGRDSAAIAIAAEESAAEGAPKDIPPCPLTPA
jgi:predicted dehydrogenase